MKSAYELAMERLAKSAPIAKLNDAQKKEIAELDSRYSAKVAEREIFLKAEIAKAAAKGDWEEMDKIEKQLVNERKALHEEREEKKQKVRAGK